MAANSQNTQSRLGAILSVCMVLALIGCWRHQTVYLLHDPPSDATFDLVLQAASDVPDWEIYSIDRTNKKIVIVIPGRTYTVDEYVPYTRGEKKWREILGKKDKSGRYKEVERTGPLQGILLRMFPRPQGSTLKVQSSTDKGLLTFEKNIKKLLGVPIDKRPKHPPETEQSP